MPTQPNPQVLASSLTNGAQLFVFSVRQWLIAARSKQSVRDRLEPFYERYHVGAALPVLDELMGLLALAAYRPVQVNCPCRVDLGDDELMLLKALQAVQRQDQGEAVEVLNDVLTGAFRTTFTRIAAAYLDIFSSASMGVTGMRYLTAVPSRGTAELH